MADHRRGRLRAVWLRRVVSHPDLSRQPVGAVDHAKLKQYQQLSRMKFNGSGLQSPNIC